MRSRLQPLLARRPSASMVVALIALGIALGGTALAAPNKKAGTLNRATVAKIAKREARAILAKQASSLKVASAGTAATATNADHAADAGALGGKPPSAYALSQGEPYREVGTSGQPAFETAWVNFPEGLATVAFYKDPVGVVHLRGTAFHEAKAGLAPVFTLPPGYRPSAALYFNIFDISTMQPLYVFPNGAVLTGCDSAPCYAPLDGISFRAEQ